MRFKSSLPALALATAYSVGLSTSAQALPIFSESTSIQVENLTFYSDHKDPNLLHYFPDSSDYARIEQGVPLFGFTYWGISTNRPIDEAGGYMTFSAKLRSSEQQKSALQSMVAKGKKVALLPVIASEVKLSRNGSDPNEGPSEAPLSKFFDELTLPQNVSPGAEMGVNAILNGPGATVFRALLLRDQQPLKLDYCYQSMGVGPNFGATIEVNWKQIHDHFAAYPSNGVKSWTRAEITRETEHLTKDEAIKITVKGGDATDFEYVNEIRDSIIARLFRLEGQTQPGGVGTGPSWNSSLFKLAIQDKIEEGTVSWVLTGRKAFTQNTCVPMNLGGVASYASQLIKDADKN